MSDLHHWIVRRRNGRVLDWASFGRLSMGLSALAMVGNLWAATRVNVFLDEQGKEQLRSVSLTGETQWGLNGSPYIIENWFNVAEGAILRIPAGVKVQVKEPYGIRILGQLIAQGATFESVDEGKWTGIYIGGEGASGSVLENCLVQNSALDLGIYNGRWVRAGVYLDHCSPTLRGNEIRVLDGHGIELHTSNAVVENNQIEVASAKGYAIWNETINSFPRFTGNTASGVGFLGVGLPGGSISVSGEWTQGGPELPYLPVSGLQVTEGTDLRLAPGLTVQMPPATWKVWGSLKAEGTVTNPVRFLGPWGGLYFGPKAGSSVLQHCELNDAGAVDLGVFNGSWRRSAIYVEQSSPRFEHVTVNRSGGNGIELNHASPVFVGSQILDSVKHGLVARAESRPNLIDTQFIRNGSAGFYTVWTDPSSVPDPDGVQFQDNAQQGIEVTGGAVVGETVWELWASNAPYVISAVMEVPEGEVLRVNPGVVVKGAGSSVLVRGTLEAEAEEANPIVFTSIRDDRFAGDTNGDGSESNPSAGDWRGIYLGENAGASVIRNVEFRFGGGSNFGVFNGAWREALLYIDKSAPTILNSFFFDSQGHGIELFQANGSIQDCRFVNVKPDRFPIVFDTLDTYPSLSGNHSEGTGQHFVSVPSGSMSTKGRWTRPGVDLPYFPQGGFSIAEEGELILEAGVTVGFSESSLRVHGRLVAQGTEQDPVRFRSRQAQPAPGQWRGVYFGPTASASELVHWQVSHTGGDLGVFQGAWRAAAVYLDACNPLMENVKISQALSNGLEMYESSVRLEGVSVEACERIALVLRGNSRPQLIDTQFLGNGSSGHYTIWTDPTCDPEAMGVRFEGNQQPGVQVAAGTILQDTNWESWGAAVPYVVTGPVTVSEGVQLKVAPNTVVKFASTKLWVNGTLTANGEEGPIAFTSSLDDSRGGDSNGDGEMTSPSAGNWQGIYLGPTAGDSSFRNCAFRFGGGAGFGVINGVWREATLYFDHCHPTLLHSDIEFSKGDGLELYSSDAFVRRNRFVDTGRYPMVYDNLNCFPQLSDNEVIGESDLGISIPGGALSRSIVWMNPGINFPYQTQGDLTVPVDHSLTVAAGVNVESAGHGLYINGVLSTFGTESGRVRLDGRKIGDTFHRWKGIYFGPGASDSVLTQTEVRNAASADLGVFGGSWRRAAVYVDGASPSFEQLMIVGSGGNGLELVASAAMISNTLIVNSAGSAVVDRGLEVPQLTNMTIAGNQGHGISSDNGAIALLNSIVAGNQGKGLELSGDNGFEVNRFRHNLFHSNEGGDDLVWARLDATESGSNFDRDPRFSSPENGDYHLMADSPAIDAGGGVVLSLQDLDGNLRTHGASVDMGAYEFGAEPISYGVDLAIRTKGAATWIGRGLTDSDQQRLETQLPVGIESVQELQFEYTGNVPNQVVLFGGTRPEGWDVSAFLQVEGQWIDISGSFFSSEGYSLANVVPGALQLIELKVIPGSGSDVASVWGGTFAAQSEKGERDVVSLSGIVTIPPRITEQPNGLTLVVGEPLQLSVAVEGEGALNFQWYRDEAPIDGATASNLAIGSVSLDEAGSYYVTVSGGGVIVKSDVATVIVDEPDEFEILAGPVERTVNEYDEVIFSVQVSGMGPFTYQWIRDDDPLCGELGAEFRIPSVRFHQRAFYSVRVTNNEGETAASSKVVLDVNPSESTEITAFDNNNIGAVFNLPTQATSFVLEEPLWLSRIETYHWNSGQGQALGTISIQSESGEIFGPWEVKGRCGQGGVINAYWTAYPKREIPVGVYTVIDSDPGTWSHNVESGGSGFAQVSGVLSGAPSVGNPDLNEATGLPGDWVQGGNADWFVQSIVTKDGGTALQSGDIGDGGSTRIDHTVSGPGDFSFFWKISSEQADRVQFLVDDVVISQIQGETEWQEITFPVRWGTHTLSWLYRKDSLISMGEDAVWLDDFEYLPVQLFEVEEVLPQAPRPIELSGAAPWFGQDAVLFEGNPTAQTGNISDAQVSHLGVSVEGPGRLSFVWKTSAENADKLQLFDGPELLKTIAGDNDWQEEVLDLRWGTHDLKWSYRKDSSLSQLLDAGWVSQIAFLPVPLAELGVALDNEILDWSSSGSAPWFGQADEALTNGFSAQSGNVGDGQLSDLTTTVSGPATLVFRWRSSSENPDRTQFLIDDEVQATISGETDWGVLAYAIDSENHLLTWRYQKDSSVSLGHDASWVDQVVLLSEASPGLENVLPVIEHTGGELTLLRDKLGQVLLMNVTGSEGGTVWGSNPYTDDSALGRAVVHAGVLAPGETGLVKVTILPGQASYVGTERNGVSSLGFGSWPGSYRVESLGAVSEPAPTLSIRVVNSEQVEISWESSADDWRLEMTTELGAPTIWIPTSKSVGENEGRWSVEIPVSEAVGIFRVTR